MSTHIAWLSPWNGRSAIATFGTHIIAQLRRQGHRVTVFRSEVGEALTLPPLPDEGEVVALNSVHPPHFRQNFDHVVANIGNHFPYHGALPRVLDVVPSLGIFHDGFLAHFACPWAECWPAARAAPSMLANLLYGEDTPAEGPYWMPLERMVVERPMMEWLAGMTAGAFTHSSHWASRLQDACAGQVTVHALSMPDDGMPPPRPWGERIVLATIGHINSNKQAEQVLRAIASDPVLRERCEYRLLGLVEPDEQARLTYLSDSLGLPPPRFTGWLEDDALRAEIAEVDVICCLRSPLLETGSASLVTAMRSARPVLVSDHGAYADVPRGLVMPCEPGNESEAIVVHLRSLLKVEGLAAELGCRARAYTFEANSAASYVNALLPAMEAATAAGPQIAMARTFGGHLGRWGLNRNHPQAARTAGDLSQMLRWENKDAAE